MRFSVIIPALDEAGFVDKAIASAGAGIAEVIVADGGSLDGTLLSAARLGAKVVRVPRGRGAQMDGAADLATGDVFVFLHADTTLPPLWHEAVEAALGDAGVAGGAFRLSIDGRGFFYRLAERAVALRCRVLGLIYGDQAIFVRRDAFFRAGGFCKLPLMEDVDCVRRLRKAGRVVVLDKSVTTSARRWEEKGRLINTVRNWFFLALYFMGISPEALYRRYYSGGRKPH